MDLEQLELKQQLESGLTDMRAGLEKIRLSERFFKDDQWVFDWLSILGNRIDTLEQAIDIEGF